MEVSNMVSLDRDVMNEMNKYLDGITMEEILIRNTKMFHYQVMFTSDQMKQDIEVLDPYNFFHYFKTTNNQ